MRSSVSIVLFFLLSGFFLAALLGAVERSRKLLGIAGACLVVLVCIIVFIKPVQLPSLSALTHGTSTTITTAGIGAEKPAGAAITTSTGTPTSVTLPPTTTTTVVPGPSSAGGPLGDSQEVPVVR